MIPISYDNVMKGLNKSLNMRLLCPTRGETEHLFHRACELWYIKDFSKVSRNPCMIDYGQVTIIFNNFEAIPNDSWRGFRGIFMAHPQLNLNRVSPRYREIFHEMQYHNERHMESWQH